MLPNRCHSGTPKSPVLLAFSAQTFKLDKFKYEEVFLQFTGKIFKIWLIFYLLFSAVNFLSIKIVSQEAECTELCGASTYSV